MRRFVRRDRRRPARDVEFARPVSRAGSTKRLERPSQGSLSRRTDKLSRPNSKTSTVKRPTTGKPSLLTLPPEIRLAIFRYILPPHHTSKKFKVYTDCDSSYTDRKWSVQRGDKTPPAESFTLAILRTNRLIYCETLSVLYSENAFHFVGSNFLPVLDFVRRLSEEARALVRQLKVTMLPGGQSVRSDQRELFCRVVHDWLPGLNVLDSDSWVWF